MLSSLAQNNQGNREGDKTFTSRRVGDIPAQFCNDSATNPPTWRNRVMSINSTPGSISSKQQAIDTAITLILVFGIIAWCFRILGPFLSVTLWAAIIAVALHKPFQKLTSLLGDRQKLSALAIALLGVLLVIVPLWMMTSSMLESVSTLSHRVEAGTLAVPPPNEKVKEWPVIGEKAYNQWTIASENMTGFLQQHKDQIKLISSAVLGKIAGIGLSAVQFFFSILIAIAFLMNAEKITYGVRLLSRRLAGDKGEALRSLAVATIRSVAVGVLGISAIQAILAGAGMMLMGVPAAGILALLVLIFAIAQLPPWAIMVPVVIYVFSVEGSSAATIAFTIWSISVSFMDMALKPMLLGRGVDAPMLVILLGAIGGMIVSGIIGLFVGAVVLAFGYMLMIAWLKAGETKPAEPAELAEPAQDS
jgi:predicted PurR-regulated permease PerM